MLIKSTVKRGPKRGTPILYTAQEAVLFAIERGVKKLNTKDRTFWVHRKSIKVTDNPSTDDGKGGYRAEAAGTAMIGYTEMVDDRFVKAKEHTFSIKYRTCKDPFIGAPDIEVLEFAVKPVGAVPHGMVFGPKEVKADPKAAPKPAAAKAPEPEAKKDEAK